MWPDLIASALTDLGKGNMDAIRVVHCCQTMVDTRRDASLAVNAWPPADDAAVRARAVGSLSLCAAIPINLMRANAPASPRLGGCKTVQACHPPLGPPHNALIMVH